MKNQSRILKVAIDCLSIIGAITMKIAIGCLSTIILIVGGIVLFIWVLSLLNGGDGGYDDYNYGRDDYELESQKFFVA